ncbi:MAG: class I SAM-dependent methyltransferase [Calothrix sp. MO_192.B10]|nr:class I SAM-dependent methyltransferase [Calothrix sp. MO_192.B10]
MTLVSELMRRLLWLPDVLLGGPAYARHLYLTRNNTPLDASVVWEGLTQPENPLFHWLSDHYPPPVIRKLLLNIYANSRDRIAGVSEHYDISNEFYQLFLDRRYMFYTCADFVCDTDTIETAQERKANYILNLVDPQPGERILDLGCGWGSMMKKVYETTGDADNLVGYTLAQEQIRFIQDTYGFRAEFKDVVTTEFEPESFDKIYSVGCIEHIPVRHLLPVARRLAQTIKPTGRIVHHFFCQLSEAPPTRLFALGVKMFPGAELTSLQHHLKVFDQAGLHIAHQSIHNYRPTLRAWYDRLVEHQDEAIKLVGVHNYNRYLCYLADAWRLFDDRDLVLTRFVLQRQDAPVKLQVDVNCHAAEPMPSAAEKVMSWAT